MSAYLAESTGDLVARIRDHGGAPVTAIGSGGRQGRGGPARHETDVVSMVRWDRIHEHAHDDLTVSVQCGMPLDRLARELAAHDQWLPLFFTPDAGTVGGALAADRRGPLAGAFGSLRDLVLGMSMVDGRGRILHAGGRVVKNVAGYDLMKLWIGSLGELGILTDVTLRLYPRPATWAGVVYAWPAGDRGTRVPATGPVRWAPTLLCRTRRGGEDRLVVLFAGARERVSALAERAADDLGERARPLGEDEALEKLSGLERDTVRFRGWGGALPGELTGTVTAAGDFVFDLLRGHVWVDVAPGNPTTIAPWREQWTSGHVHVDGAVEPWGRVPEDELDLWHALKNAFDPDGRLVAGRLPGGV